MESSRNAVLNGKICIHGQSTAVDTDKSILFHVNYQWVLVLCAIERQFGTYFFFKIND